MVNGIPQLRARLHAIPPRIEAELTREIGRIAEQIVKQMRRINPLPGDILIGWTFGTPPRGSVVLARSPPQRGSYVVRATIYATARTGAFPGGFPAVARWFEFGTGPRVQRKTGRYTGLIVAQPYFFPVFRSERGRARAAMTRAVRRTIQSS